MKNKSIEWSKYIKIIVPKWKSILNDPKTIENDVQKFFEDNPCMVPGAYGFFNPSGHHPYPGALISQPILPEFTFKKPDFMWISINSGEIRPVLIEIEKPSKKHFNEDGGLSKDFEDALEQLDNWENWFERDNDNKQRFKDYYRIPSHQFIKLVEPLYILIYGRESELKSKRNIEKRAIRKKDNREIMTFDRLEPEENCSHYPTIRLKSNGDETEYEAISVPSTFGIFEAISNYYKEIVGIDIAIKNNKDISEDRKSVLINILKNIKSQKDDDKVKITQAGLIL